MAKLKTLAQVEAMQQKAVRFAEDVLEDDELADELDSLSVEEYADRKGVRIAENPSRPVALQRKGWIPARPTQGKDRNKDMAQQTKAELLERIAELEEENEALYEERAQIRELLGEDEEEEEDEEEDEDEE